jgi:hypothetical protein
VTTDYQDALKIELSIYRHVKYAKNLEIQFYLMDNFPPEGGSQSSLNVNLTAALYDIWIGMLAGGLFYDFFKNYLDGSDDCLRLVFGFRYEDFETWSSDKLRDI